MLELEGQGGRAVVHLDVHPRVTITGLEKHGGLEGGIEASLIIIRYSLLFYPESSDEFRQSSWSTVRFTKNLRRVKDAASRRTRSFGNFSGGRRYLSAMKYKNTHVHAHGHGEFLFFKSKRVVGRSFFKLRLTRRKNLTAELRVARKITHGEKSHHASKDRKFPSLNLYLL